MAGNVDGIRYNTNPEIRALMKKLNVTQKQIAEANNMALTTVNRYLKNPMPENLAWAMEESIRRIARDRDSNSK